MSADRCRWSRLRLGVVSAVTLALAAGAAGAGVKALLSDEVINACRSTSSGALRVPAGTACRSDEQPLRWNVRGMAGATGPQGPPGPVSVDRLAGTTCTTAAGSVGSLQVGTAADGAVTFSCRAQVDPEAPPELTVNEIDYDQVGADTGGFVELFNAGRGTADLGGLALVLVDGVTAAAYRSIPLSGAILAGEFHVVPVDAQNGSPDGVALVDTVDRVLVDALSYEGAIEHARIGSSVYDLVEGTALPPSVADSDAVTGSLVRMPDGSDTDDADTDWSFTTRPTPGNPNLAG